MSSATHPDEIVSIFAGRMDVIGFGTVDLRRAYGVKLGSQGIIGLIGRDILENLILVYNGPDGTFSLAS